MLVCVKMQVFDCIHPGKWYMTEFDRCKCIRVNFLHYKHVASITVRTYFLFYIRKLLLTYADGFYYPTLLNLMMTTQKTEGNLRLCADKVLNLFLTV